MKMQTQFRGIQEQWHASPVGCERPGPTKLRVLFVTEEDPLYVIRFFDIFFAEYPRDEFEICGITVDRAFHQPIWKTLRRMQVFYGPWDVFRQGGRFIQAKLRGRSIEALALTMGVAIVRACSVNSPEYIGRVRAMAPDIIVSVAAPEISPCRGSAASTCTAGGSRPTAACCPRSGKCCEVSRQRPSRCTQWQKRSTQVTCWRRRVLPSSRVTRLTASSLEPNAKARSS